MGEKSEKADDDESAGTRVTLADVIARFDHGPAERLFTLILASKEGADAVDAWLAEHETSSGGSSSEGPSVGIRRFSLR